MSLCCFQAKISQTNHCGLGEVQFSWYEYIIQKISLNPGIRGIYTNGGKFEAPFAYQKQIKAIWYNGITIYNYGIRDPRQTCPSSPPLAPDCPPARPKRTVLMAMVVMTPARKPSNFQGCAEKMYRIGGSKDVPGSVGWWKKRWASTVDDQGRSFTWMLGLAPLGWNIWDLFVDVCLCLFIFSYFFPYDPCLSVCHQGISRTSTPVNIHISPRQVSKPALSSSKCIMTQHPCLN